jgi:hypothetical protein
MVVGSFSVPTMVFFLSVVFSLFLGFEMSICGQPGQTVIWHDRGSARHIWWDWQQISASTSARLSPPQRVFRSSQSHAFSIWMTAQPSSLACSVFFLLVLFCLHLSCGVCL